MEHECVIGFIYDYDNIQLITLSELKKHIQEKEEHNEWIDDTFVDLGWTRTKIWTLKEYADKRRNTDLERFEFCPICGKKIDWQKIRKAEK